MTPRILGAARLAPVLLASSALIAGSLGLATPAQAVVAMHTISGTIVDSSGHPVATHVALEDSDGNAVDDAPTDLAGRYSFAEGDDDYTLQVEPASGYVAKTYYPSVNGTNVVQNVTLYTTAEESACTEPTFTGSPTVGSTVTATGANISAVQWAYSTGESGGAVQGATATTFQVPADLLGYNLSVSRSYDAGVNYADYACNSSAGVPVTAGGPVPVGGVPTVAHAGKVKPGKTLTANPGDLPAGSTVTYQWIRVVKKSKHHRLVPKAITGATSASYKVKKKDTGTKVYAQMVVTNPAYAAHTVSTTPVKVKKKK